MASVAVTQFLKVGKTVFIAGTASSSARGLVCRDSSASVRRWFARQAECAIDASLGALYGRQNRLRGKRKIPKPFNPIPLVQSAREKYSASHPPQSMASRWYPASMRGAYRDRHERGGGMRWTRWCCKTNGAARGRPSRVVLAPRCWR